MKRTLLWAAVLVTMVSSFALSQDGGLNIFGYFQSSFYRYTNHNSNEVQTSFNMNQLNLLLQKDFGSDFSAFVNFELTNTFDTKRGWGRYKIEEAWVKYTYADWLNVRAGLLIPRFNNLNEIKNRTPLLLYAFRPIAYETTIDGIITLEDYAPGQAFLQVDGFVPLGALNVDYAAYVGNSESGYINTDGEIYSPSGVDYTPMKLVGGRLGARYGATKAGVSFTHDRDYRREPILTANQFGPGFPPVDLATLGDLVRTRLGFDFSTSLYGFSFEGEYTKVSTDPTTVQQQALDQLKLFTGGLYGNTIEKTFYYANLGYDVFSNTTVYAGYSYLEEKLESFIADGLPSYTAGITFRPIDQIALKAQYITFKLNNTQTVNVDFEYIYAAVSVYF